MGNYHIRTGVLRGGLPSALSSLTPNTSPAERERGGPHLAV
jgi:hypothetical protein